MCGTVTTPASVWTNYTRVVRSWGSESPPRCNKIPEHICLKKLDLQRRMDRTERRSHISFTSPLQEAVRCFQGTANVITPIYGITLSPCTVKSLVLASGPALRRCPSLTAGAETGLQNEDGWWWKRRGKRWNPLFSSKAWKSSGEKRTEKTLLRKSNSEGKKHVLTTCSLIQQEIWLPLSITPAEYWRCKKKMGVSQFILSLIYKEKY